MSEKARFKATNGGSWRWALRELQYSTTGGASGMEPAGEVPDYTVNRRHNTISSFRRSRTPEDVPSSYFSLPTAILSSQQLLWPWCGRHTNNYCPMRTPTTLYAQWTPQSTIRGNIDFTNVCNFSKSNTPKPHKLAVYGVVARTTFLRSTSSRLRRRVGIGAAGILGTVSGVGTGGKGHPDTHHFSEYRRCTKPSLIVFDVLVCALMKESQHNLFSLHRAGWKGREEKGGWRQKIPMGLIQYQSPLLT
ncbi:hypothetical protein B0H14DRAFT_2563610 [Mycena olivaceomarginata]|nr:hypothetical protein B0H14DRAFT_2563610 [Mycena olivaceomarginata]